MKKNRRILGRVLATEISDSALHQVSGSNELEEGGDCPAESGTDDTVIVHHTGTRHTDCHIDGHDLAS
jgi:hypothetical protein